MAKRISAFLILFWFVFINMGGATSPQMRIKDIARVAGTDTNTLTGTGLVVGLAGSGDGSMTKVTNQMVANILARFGTDPGEDVLRGRNAALVMVTAQLPTFAQAGDRLDVTVASLGDARSLEGGVLIETELKGVDGQTYALAAGSLLVGGASVQSRGASARRNQTTVGRVPDGALVIQALPGELLTKENQLALVLHTPDFTTAARTAAAINAAFGPGRACALDDRTVQLTPPGDLEIIPFLAAVEQLTVAVDQPARVVINERTGTVAIGGEVRIATVAVAQGNLNVKITPETMVSQPYPWSEGETRVVKQPHLEMTTDTGKLFLLPGPSTVGELVTALNAVGASPHDIIAILETLKAQGALYGELIVQ